MTPPRTLPRPVPERPTAEPPPAAQAELDALIEEARRRARRRRAGYAAITALAALLASGLFVAFGGGGGGRAALHPRGLKRPSGRHGGAPASGASARDPWNGYETHVLPASGVQLASARVGFALTGEPTPGFDGNLASPAGLAIAWPSPTVTITRDGAHHWARSLATPGGFWGLDVLDPKHVWAVGVKALYRSVDGGTSWERAGEPVKPLVRVAFTTPATGLGLTVNGRLVRTEDSGETWMASRWHGQGAAMCASDAGTILVATQNGGIWRSVSAGRSLQVAPGFAHIQQYRGWPTQLSCRGSNAVEISQAFCEAACGGGVLTLVRQSTDGGLVWQTITTQYAGAAPTRSLPTSAPDALLDAAAVGNRGACLIGGYADGQRPGIAIGCADRAGTGYRKATTPGLPFATRRNHITVQGIDFLNTHTGWLLLDATKGTIANSTIARANTEVLITHNDGHTWQRAYLSLTYRANWCPSAPPTNSMCWKNPLG